MIIYHFLKMHFFYKGGGGIFKVCASYAVRIAATSCTGNKEIPEGLLVAR